MGLIISEEEANARLNNPDNLANKIGTKTTIRTSIPDKTSSLQDTYNKPRENGPNNDSDQLVSIRPVDNGGRRPGDTNVPEVIRSLAAVLTNNGEAAQSVAEGLGISKSSVDQYKEGNTSFGRPNAQLRSVIRENLDKIQEKAIGKMLKGIDFMDFNDETKMAKVSYRDMSNILLNLHKLVGGEAGDDEKKDTTKLIIYAPSVKTEQHFQVVEVRES
jgi:predicted transcriptional regulator